MNSLIIGAATSNSGKTTFTIGLLRALRNRGMNVQPYKCGPDYIDTMFHRMASGNESINLDTFMTSENHVCDLFHWYGSAADIRVVEGVMGLFDGYERSRGSSAEIAMLLDIPVVLVVNARSVAYSVAPLIYGFKNFNPRLRVAGVVFNMVASENHYSFLKSACDDAGVECLGYLPRNEKLVIPGRHLGLTISAREETERLINLAAEEIEKHVDIERLLQLTVHRNDAPHTDIPHTASADKVIAVARDEAFNFTYRANIDTLRTKGEVIYFSPLHDTTLPTCDMLYLPGGYPELFADALQANESMRDSIRMYAEGGGHIFAECGGFMYLCQDIDGASMCGVLPIHATMDKARLHLGYRQVAADAPLCLCDSLGLYATRGHEFHYSDIKEEALPASVKKEQCQLSAKGTSVPTAIYRYKNVVAGYTHWQLNFPATVSPLAETKGDFTFVSLGPGGRDNMTLGTYDALMNASHIFCFGSSGKSYALDIMTDAGIDSNKVTVVDIPMRDNRDDAFAVYDALVEQLKSMDGNIVIATEGDTGIYATTHYVMDRLQADGYEVRQTAGVPSFIAAGAMAGISLVSQHQRLLVVPGMIDEAELNEKLTSGDTIVIMKLSRLTDTIHSFIASHPEYEYHYIEKVGTPQARHITDVETLLSMEYPYFSLMIIK